MMRRVSALATPPAIFSQPLKFGGHFWLNMCLIGYQPLHSMEGTWRADPFDQANAFNGADVMDGRERSEANS